MAGADELAHQLVEYDDRLALEVLTLLEGRLGGKRSGSISEKVEFLADPEQARLRTLIRLEDVASAAGSTGEWKTEFGHSERLRRIALALARELQGR